MLRADNLTTFTCGLSRNYESLNFLEHQRNVQACYYLIITKSIIVSHVCNDNKVRELIAVKLLHTSLLNTTWSPSKYSPWEAMHRCQRLVHPSKQFWKWFCGMAFRAAIVLLLMSSMSSKCLPFNITFIFGNRKKFSGG